jgi:hypothetical protein
LAALKRRVKIWHSKAILKTSRIRRRKTYPSAMEKIKVDEDLIKGVFSLAKVVRIERKYDPNTSTSFKTGDLTPKTMNELIEEGEKDAEFI